MPHHHSNARAARRHPQQAHPVSSEIPSPPAAPDHATEQAQPWFEYLRQPQAAQRPSPSYLAAIPRFLLVGAGVGALALVIRTIRRLGRAPA